MDLKSTHLAKYSDIEVDEVDLYEDAWGLNAEFGDVFRFLDQLDITELNDFTDLPDFKGFKDQADFMDSKPD